MNIDTIMGMNVGSNRYHLIPILIIIIFFIPLFTSCIVDNQEIKSIRLSPIKNRFEDGKTIVVDHSGNGNYTTISTAITNAEPGDTIFIENGSYQERFDLSKRLRIIGESETNTTIIANSTEGVIGIYAKGCYVSNLRIQQAIGLMDNTGIVVHSDNNTIENCIVNDLWYGIHIDGGNGNYFINCSVESNYYGIYLFESNENQIINCICDNTHTDGIKLKNSKNNHISYSSFNSTNDGILFSDSTYNTISHCYFYNNHDYGIYFSHSDHNLIRNCHFKSNKQGIYFQISNGNKIENCVSNENIHHGILIDQESSYNSIYNSTCNLNTGKGIHIGVDCSYTTIENVICNNNWDYGITLYHGNYNTVKNSTCKSNKYGIFVEWGKFCEVSGNLLEDNKKDGIFVERGSGDNTFDMNIFRSNNRGLIQASDYGFRNNWNSSVGNYWDDWISPDLNKDGIVDSPYVLNGDADSKDYLPVGEPGFEDSDNDDFPDFIEDYFKTDKYDSSSTPPDLDGDKIPDALDPDRDGDGHPNEEDDFPDDPDEWEEDKIRSNFWLIVLLIVLLLATMITVIAILKFKKKSSKSIKDDK